LPTIETAEAEVKMGECECCGKGNLQFNELVRIDSGQLFCRECLNALRGSAR
jgi:transposase